ncbi:uncharacterized protein LOC141914505 [Tubulanus polymorphus]|uniref:uncharacterized protein LOC141914505 n=1 Tax=Tubulanus polymorphus TaxID=672921 RepID=UPI003DA1CBD1
MPKRIHKSVKYIEDDDSDDDFVPPARGDEVETSGQEDQPPKKKSRRPNRKKKDTKGKYGFIITCNDKGSSCRDIHDCLFECVRNKKKPSMGRKGAHRWDYDVRQTVYAVMRDREDNFSIQFIHVPHLCRKQDTLCWKDLIMVTQDDEPAVWEHYSNVLTKEIQTHMKKKMKPTTGMMREMICEHYTGFTLAHEKNVPKNLHSSTSYQCGDNIGKIFAKRVRIGAVLENTRRIKRLEKNVSTVVRHIQDTTNTTVDNIIEPKVQSDSDHESETATDNDISNYVDTTTAYVPNNSNVQELLQQPKPGTSAASEADAIPIPITESAPAPAPEQGQGPAPIPATVSYLEIPGSVVLSVPEPKTQHQQHFYQLQQNQSFQQQPAHNAYQQYPVYPYQHLHHPQQAYPANFQQHHQSQLDPQQPYPDLPQYDYNYMELSTINMFSLRDMLEDNSTFMLGTTFTNATIVPENATNTFDQPKTKDDLLDEIFDELVATESRQVENPAAGENREELNTPPPMTCNQNGEVDLLATAVIAAELDLSMRTAEFDAINPPPIMERLNVGKPKKVEPEPEPEPKQPQSPPQIFGEDALDMMLSNNMDDDNDYELFGNTCETEMDDDPLFADEAPPPLLIPFVKKDTLPPAPVQKSPKPSSIIREECSRKPTIPKKSVAKQPPPPSIKPTTKSTTKPASNKPTKPKINTKSTGRFTQSEFMEAKRTYHQKFRSVWKFDNGSFVTSQADAKPLLPASAIYCTDNTVIGMLRDSISNLGLEDDVYLASPTEFYKWEKMGKSSFKPVNSWLSHQKRYSVMPCRVTFNQDINNTVFKHWVLLISDSKRKEVRIFDSLLEDTADWIYPLLKKYTNYDLSEWNLRPHDDQSYYLFRQSDGHSCGVYVAMNFDCYMRFKIHGERVSDIRKDITDLVEYKKQKFVAFMKRVQIITQTCCIKNVGGRPRAPRKDITNCDDDDDDDDCIFVSETKSESDSESKDSPLKTPPPPPPPLDFYSVPADLLDSDCESEPEFVKNIGVTLTPPPPVFDDDLPDIKPIKSKRNTLTKRKCADCPPTPVDAKKPKRGCKN